MREETFLKVGLILVVLAIFAYFATVGIVDQTKPKAEQEGKLKLGLDLKGGVKLIYKLDLSLAENPSNTLENTRKVFERRLNKFGLAEINIYKVGRDRIGIEVPGADAGTAQSIKNLVEVKGTIAFCPIQKESYDGTPLSDMADSLADETDRNELPPLPPDADWVPVADKPLTIADIGANLRFVPIKFKGIERRVKAEVTFPDGEIHLLDLVNPNRATILAEPLTDEAGEYLAGREFEKDENGFYRVPRTELAKRNWIPKGAERKKWTPYFTGKDLKTLYETTGQDGDRVIAFETIGSKQAEFERFTSEHLKEPLPIIINDQVYSAPTIQDVLPGSGIISGYPEQERRYLIIALKSGALEILPELASESYLGPGIGSDQIAQGRLAIIIGFVLVVLFVLIYYQFAGFVANLALFFNLIIILGFMTMFRATLTLPGIAGILLTIGMSVDANILIFERIREERALGKTLRQSVINGYQRAFVTIVDANVTTFITAVILYWLGTPQIKGFAVTLMVGIAASMFTALFVTRAIFDILIERRLLKKLTMLKLIGRPNIKFMSFLKFTVVASVALIIAGLAVFTFVRDEMFGTDFTGGSVVTVRFKESMDIEELRATLEELANADGSARYPNIGIKESYDPVARAAHAGATDFEIIVKGSFATGEGEASRTRDLSKEIKADIMGAWADKLVPDTVHDVKVLGEDREKTKLSTRFAVSKSMAVADAEAVVRGVTEDGEQFLEDAAVTGVGAESEDASFRIFEIETPEFDLTARTIDDNPKDETYYALLIKDGIADELDKIGGVDLREPFPIVDTVGPQIASELQVNALLALILSLIAIVIYIYIRFNKQWKFGLAAVLAIVHDCFVTLGFLAFAVAMQNTFIGKFLGFQQIEINLPIVGAFLMIIGYSLNDTIVVFDRIRENIKGRKKMALKEIIDISVNQTLSRTILTSMTTFMTVLILFLIGGKVIHDLAFALCVGVIVGTYSSVFIAAPVLTFWDPSKDVLAEAEREERETGAGL